MESENLSPGSPCGGPVLEPSTQGHGAPALSPGSRASAASERSEGPLMPGGPGHNAPEWMAEELDQSEGGGAHAAGRDGESRTPRFRQVNISLRADTHSRIDGMQVESGLARTHFYSAALVIGAQVLREMCRAGGVTFARPGALQVR